MMYIHFLVIKGACIKIPAIKDDFLFENITLVTDSSIDLLGVLLSRSVW